MWIIKNTLNVFDIGSKVNTKESLFGKVIFEQISLNYNTI